MKRYNDPNDFWDWDVRPLSCVFQKNVISLIQHAQKSTVILIFHVAQVQRINGFWYRGDIVYTHGIPSNSEVSPSKNPTALFVSTDAFSTTVFPIRVQMMVIDHFECSPVGKLMNDQRGSTNIQTLYTSLVSLFVPPSRYCLTVSLLIEKQEVNYYAFQLSFYLGLPLT